MYHLISAIKSVLFYLEGVIWTYWTYFIMINARFVQSTSLFQKDMIGNIIMGL